MRIVHSALPEHGHRPLGGELRGVWEAKNLFLLASISCGLCAVAWCVRYLSSSSSTEDVLKRKKLSWCAACAILLTFSTSSSTAFMPFIFGHLGYAGAALALGLYILVASYIQQVVLEIAIRHPSAKNTPDVARLLVGEKCERFFWFLHIANQQLFLPVAIVFIITSLKHILYPLGVHAKLHTFLSCNISWVSFVVILVILVVNVIRRFGHARLLCMITSLLNVLQIVLIIIRVAWSPYRHPSGIEGASPFPSLPLNSDEHSKGHWVGFFTSFALLSYAYCPCFIITEAMQEMEDKIDMKKALWASAAVMYVMYLVAGSLPAVFWGWSRPINVLEELKNDLVGRGANACLLIAATTDFIICAVSVNNHIKERFAPSMDMNDWSLSGRATWFWCSLPPALLALLMVCSIPKLECLCGLLTAFIVPFSQMIGPVVLICAGACKDMLGRSLTAMDLFILVLAFTIGATMFVGGGAATIFTIFWKTTFKGDFFCELVAG